MRRTTLTQGQVVDAAISLLDQEGPAGLNMRALGQALDCAATAVYWHVGSKLALIELVCDQAWGEIALPMLPAGDWREAATSLATEANCMFRRHPWVVELFGTVPTFSLNKARYDECALTVYEEAGFKGREADYAAAAVFTYVLGHALGNAAEQSLRRADAATTTRRSQPDAAAWNEILSDLPRLRARVAAGADSAEAPQGSFDYGLERLLEGLESHR